MKWKTLKSGEEKCLNRGIVGTLKMAKEMANGWEYDAPQFRRQVLSCHWAVLIIAVCVHGLMSENYDAVDERCCKADY